MILARFGFALAATTLFAQVPESRWSLSLHQFNPTFEGHFNGKQDGQPLVVDLKTDLGLGKDASTPGAALEYNGRRFGLYLAMDGQTYKGDQRVNRDITIDGKTYKAGAQVHSKVKLDAMDFIWTIRAYTFEQAWIGIDLGAHAWAMDVAADGLATIQGQAQPIYQSASAKVTAPIPQFGFSVGGHFLESKGVVKAYYRFLGYKGAKYSRMGVDARFFFLPWLGVKAFMDNQTFDVPKGSLSDDLELKLDRNGAGFGVVFRF